MSKPEVQVGVDLGGTKVHSVVLGTDLDVIAQDTRLSGYGPDEVVRNIRESITDALGQLPNFSLAGIGIGTPGTVDAAAGIVRHSLNLGIESLDLRTAISDEFNCRVQLENDVNATALGLFRVHPEYSSLCYLNFGTGLAAGFVINGHVWAGASGLAGEIGHLPLADQSQPCSCGQAGCLELFSSWSGLRRSMPAVESVTTALELAKTDLAISKLWDDFVANAVLSIQTVFLTWDPEVIFVGGGVISADSEIFERIKAGIADIEQQSALFREKRVRSRILPMPAGVPVAAIGALAS